MYGLYSFILFADEMADVELVWLCWVCQIIPKIVRFYFLCILSDLLHSCKDSCSRVVKSSWCRPVPRSLQWTPAMLDEQSFLTTSRRCSDRYPWWCQTTVSQSTLCITIRRPAWDAACCYCCSVDCLDVSVCCAETDEPIKITFGVRRGLVGPKQPLLSGVGAQISSTGVIRVSPSLQWILATRHKHSFLTTSSHCFNWYTWWRKPGWAISMKRLSVWISYRSEHDDDDDISLLVKTANDKRKCWNRKRKKKHQIINKKTPKTQIILWS